MKLNSCDSNYTNIFSQKQEKQLDTYIRSIRNHCKTVEPTETISFMFLLHFVQQNWISKLCACRPGVLHLGLDCAFPLAFKNH